MRFDFQSFGKPGDQPVLHSFYRLDCWWDRRRSSCILLLGSVRLEPLLNLNDLQPLLQETLTTHVPLQLATGRLGNATSLDQYHGVNGEFVLLHNCLPDCLNEGLCLDRASLTFYLLHDNKALCPVLLNLLNRKHCTTMRPQEWVAAFQRLFDCLFYIFGIVIAAVDNDQIFETAGHKQLAVLYETQVARP